MNELNDDLLELDTSWLDEFEKTDNDYKSYYAEDVSFINLHCIYINNFNEITKVHEEKILFKTPGLLSREEVLGLIKRNTFLHNTKYSLLSILKFNINIEPINLKTFLRSKDSAVNIGKHFLQPIKNIDSISFVKTIGMFQDINDLFIIFHNKNDIKNTNQPNQNINPRNNISTRKIYLNPNSFKKTRRNLFKDMNTL
jgi:hypothetical protein